MREAVNDHTLTTLSVGLTETIEAIVTPDSVALFAALSGDCSPLHVDPEFALQHGFKGCVAHGMLIGAHVSALVGTKLPGRHGLMQSCELQFRAPLVPPETLSISGEVINISAGTGQLSIRITVKNSTGHLLVTGLVKSILNLEARA